MGMILHKLLAVASVSLLTAACTQREEIGTAAYSGEQCRRVALVDVETGDVLRGAEDLAADPMRGLLFVSAYDRRAVEKAAGRGAAEVPNGGVYSLPLPDLFDVSNTSVKAISLASPDDIAGGLRPHGMHYDARHQELIFVNRTYQRIDKKWRMMPRLQRIGVNGEVVIGAEPSAIPCAANNVLLTEQQVFTSFDHSSCGWRGGFEAIFNLKRSGVVLEGAGAVYDRAGFANGLARTSEGDIVMAATREGALIVFSERAGAIEETGRIELPGGPDNLSLAHDGGVVAAIHPSLWRLALNRKLGIGRSPSRIVKTDPETREIEILFDDPSGKLFSAATAAIETKYGMIAGSVTDEGLLVCRVPAEA